MKLTTTVLVTAVVFMGATAANATTVSKTPGHQMQTKGSLKDHPGASGYAPGHRMQAKGSVKGHPGASGYAPGHATTTGSGSSR